MVRRSTLVVVILFVVAVGVALLLQRTGFGKEATPTPTEQVSVISFGADTLVRISLTDQAGNEVVYVKNAEGIWSPQAEGMVIGDMTTFNNALTQLGTLRALNVIQNPPGAQEIGLQPPAYHLVVTNSEGLTQELDVGSMTPTGSGYYVRTGQSGVYVVSQFNLDTVLKLITAPDLIGTPTPVVTPTPTEGATTE